MMNWSTKYLVNQKKKEKEKKNIFGPFYFLFYLRQPKSTHCTLYDHRQAMTVKVFKKSSFSLFFLLSLFSAIMWSFILLDIHYDLEYTCK